MQPKPLPPWLYDLSYGFQAYYLAVLLCPLETIARAQVQRNAQAAKNEEEWTSANPHAGSSNLKGFTSSSFQESPSPHDGSGGRRLDEHPSMNRDSDAVSAKSVTFVSSRLDIELASSESANRSASRDSRGTVSSGSRGGSRGGSLRFGSLIGVKSPEGDDEIDESDESDEDAKGPVTTQEQRGDAQETSNDSAPPEKQDAASTIDGQRDGPPLTASVTKL